MDSALTTEATMASPPQEKRSFPAAFPDVDDEPDRKRPRIGHGMLELEDDLDQHTPDGDGLKDMISASPSRPSTPALHGGPSIPFAHLKIPAVLELPFDYEVLPSLLDLSRPLDSADSDQLLKVASYFSQPRSVRPIPTLLPAELSLPNRPSKPLKHKVHFHRKYSRPPSHVCYSHLPSGFKLPHRNAQHHESAIILANTPVDGSLTLTGYADSPDQSSLAKCSRIAQVLSRRVIPNNVKPNKAKTQEDLILADERGCVKVISGRITAAVEELGEMTTCIDVGTDFSGKTYIIAGTAEGTISAFNMTDTLWRTRVDSIPLSQPPLRHPASGREIRHLLSAHISDPHGDVYNVVLACDENPLIHVLSEGREILQVVVPAKVLAMCTGHFINPRVLQNDSQGDPPSHRHGEQVLISTESGLYVLYDWFKIASYASPISSPVYLKAFSFSSTGTTTSHVLTYTPTSLCLDIYKNGNVVHSIPMESTLIALDLRVGTADLIDVVVSLSDGNVWWWRIEEGVEEGEILE